MYVLLLARLLNYHSFSLHMRCKVLPLPVSLILVCTVMINDAKCNVTFCVILQARARKLRIFPNEGHPFEKHPQLVAWEMPLRKLRANKEFYDLPEEYEPMNPEAYRKRFWHMMNAAQQQRVLQYEHNQQAGSEPQQ